MSEKRYLVKGYGVAPSGEDIFGIFDSRTKSPYHLYALNDEGLNKIARIMNEQQSTIESLKEENEELKRKLEYCEHEHFLDKLGSSNKWFGMGGF